MNKTNQNHTVWDSVIDFFNLISVKEVGRKLRLFAFAILFGGSITILYVAVSLINIAVANGVPAAQAAATNAPIFVRFSYLAGPAAFVLLLGELLDYFCTAKPDRRKVVVRYVTSFLCAACTLVFAWVLVPAMERLRPIINSNASAHADFIKLHDYSRIVFGGIIIFAANLLLFPAKRDQD